MSDKLINVGGQAVIEGVMMRSPNSLAVAVRRPTGEIAMREAAWVSLFNKIHFLKKPFLRGTVILVEALVNGIQALSYSANQAIIEESDGKKEEEKISPIAMAMTVAFALALGLFLFVGLPHLLTWLALDASNNDTGVDSIMFHVIDTVIKIIIFISYIYLIGRIPDIKRVFMYHGAEHKSIYCYENKQPLTVENAKRFSTLHPRCGTSFIIMVLLISLFVFGAVFPFFPKISESDIINHLCLIIIKIPLMFPIAGLAYEFIKFSGKHSDNPILQLFIAPGLWLQRITTKEPTDDQIEIALCSLRKTLWREVHKEDGIKAGWGDGNEEIFTNFEEVAKRY